MYNYVQLQRISVSPPHFLPRIIPPLLLSTVLNNFTSPLGNVVRIFIGHYHTMIVITFIGILLAVAVLLTLLVIAFVNEPPRTEVKPSDEEVQHFLQVAYDLKTNPQDKESLTFGELLEQGHFDQLVQEPQILHSLQKGA